MEKENFKKGCEGQKNSTLRFSRCLFCSPWIFFFRILTRGTKMFCLCLEFQINARNATEIFHPRKMDSEANSGLKWIKKD